MIKKSSGPSKQQWETSHRHDENTAPTHTLVVVKHPAGFAVEAFVVLRARTLPT